MKDCKKNGEKKQKNLKTVYGTQKRAGEKTEMGCRNCSNKIEGIAYDYNGLLFCGKSCLVKFLRDINVVRIELIKGPKEGR